MAFQQLYYTSCEHGLRGFSGFQFNAATPGVAPGVMREIENLTSYEPPRSMPSDPGPDQLTGYPVAFSHSLGSGGTFVVARVVFLGTDYSGRPGNYFAHALVTESAADFGSLLPVDLWEAPLWRTAPVEVQELPPLPSSPPPGKLDRAGVQAFLRHADPLVLPALLTAVDRAMGGDRPVLLAGPDCETNASWIAAVSYLIGDELARRLSFTTYSHRPAYAGHHIIGVLSGSDTVPADQTFHVYDAATGRLPDVPVHPLAELLARVGIMRVGSLWQQAATLATGPVREFDGWYPLVAAAAALEEMRLEPEDTTAIVTWLGAAERLPANAGQILETLLDRREPYSDRQITDLHALAARLRSAVALERLELIGVDRAYSHLEQAEPAGDPIRLASQAAIAEAAHRCVEALEKVSPELAPQLLRWTADAGVALEPGEFREYGHQLDPRIDADLLAAILDGRPQIVSGLVNRLATHPAEARDLFARTQVISREDLSDLPRLEELWLLTARRRGQQSPMTAFGNIANLRRKNRVELDADLLDELWPDGCSSSDLLKILPVVAGAGLTDWLVERISVTLETGSGDDRVALASILERFPDIRDRLPDDLRKSAVGLSKVDAQLKSAKTKVDRGDTRIFKQLYQEYQSYRGNEQAQKLLRRRIPGLLGETKRLDLALRGCPDPVRKTFCQGVLKDQLSPLTADASLAARVFLAMLALEQERREQAAVQDLASALEKVLDWSGGQRRALRKELGRDYAEEFDQWRERIRPGTLVKIRGLFGARKDGGQQ
jgi:hypothetical protein